MQKNSQQRINSERFWDALPPPWNSDIQETLTCIQIRVETHDVKSFIFATPDNSGFTFRPGQFITLELEIEGETINRCYTISSTPTRPHTLSITVKRVPNGSVSNWLHDNLKAGDNVRVLGAAGEFTCVTFPADKYLFLSAGSGITPLMSMARTHFDLSDDRDITFIHSARTPDDIIFERELALIASSQQNFRTCFICERLGARRDWHGPTGMLSLSALTLMAPDFMEREIFVCGPAPYMKAVRSMLDAAGFERQHYHEESFSFENLPEEVREGVLEAVLEAHQEAAPNAELELAISPPSTEVAALALLIKSPEVTSFKVMFQKSAREIVCGAQQHVLEAARATGVRLASSCAQGMCGTCKVKLISGQVAMQHKGGIRQREIDQGMVLLCCSKPLTDLVIDK
ncbi:FAD-binding oxidoreductase [Glaciimonas sp. Gout2]|uniref:FAD-binding oxidoreductase n=1 Tax=unclassified Glaciimonas TaxID=2644401 RepID=UPI002B22C226|nr:MULTISPECIES: FAD-binding oxidoreductase [unclassified Glaciimonas]MEB0013475.1 FAD-binding oxidoreductase [Glaciimonas sp. Cout2]MEB0081554.1 FAD-binding oxidoreductase [Glaciimonas sp. Gout2]